MYNNIYDLPQEACSGCSGCLNSCPTDAIRMVENAEGFIVPHIDEEKCVSCGKCAKNCPSLHVSHTNAPNPQMFAVRADDAVRRESSSGGMFTVLAEYIFSLGGAVCGAAFDSKMRLRHVIANKPKELAPLRGSKYVQSDIGLIYREVAELLKRDRYVLFTGTPCQCAALQAFLGKPYDKLYTMDLICHGVPSQKIFQQYLSECHAGKQVKNVSFRDKANGWRSDLLTVSYADGDQYVGNLRKDPYQIGFQRNLTLRRSCADCDFSVCPRQADISVGDFWGINDIDASCNDAKGTSVVLLNNEKGTDLFQKVSAKLFAFKEMQLPFDALKNRVRKHYPAHPARERMFGLIEKGRPMAEAVKKSNDNQYDVGVVGIYTVENFGGALTYYALYNVLTDMGYDCLMVERPRTARHKPAQRQVYTVDPYPAHDKAEIYANKTQMRCLNDRCRAFMVGSDQMFNDHLYHQFGEWVTLDWVDDNKKKIAYAASFGHDFIWQPETTRAEMSYAMKKFDYFSVREVSGVDICRDEFGVTAQWVLDPVFLCDIRHYQKLEEQAEHKITGPYLGAYILDLSADKEEIVTTLCSKLSLAPVVYSEMDIDRMPKNGWTLPIQKSYFINDRIANIAQCDFFIADSFHGVCVAIIYKKNFVAILNKRRGASRFLTILSKLGLTDRIVETSQDLRKCSALLKPIDYDAVYEKLNAEKERCIEWLRTAMNDTTKKSYSDYDMFTRRFLEQQQQLERVTSENRRLRNDIETIKQLLSFQSYNQLQTSTLMKQSIALRQITDLTWYLNELKQLTQEHLVVLTFRDNIGFYMNEQISGLLRQLGLTLEFHTVPKLTSYIAVINRGALVAEVTRPNAPSLLEKNVEGVQLSIESRLARQGNMTSISLDGCNYAINGRGLNIVVYSYAAKMVLDTVAFDTHSNNFDCTRG